MNIIELCQKVGFITREPVYNGEGSAYIEVTNNYNFDKVYLIALKGIFESKNIMLEDNTCITANILKELNEIDIIVPEDLLKWESITRRAYFQLRGKPVTPEQAFEIIRRTDIKFSNPKKTDDSIYMWNLTVSVISRYSLDNSWIHKNGTIGINDCTSKYPTTIELIRDAYMLLSNFPYLDFVWALTYWNEVPYDEETDEELENISLDKFLNHIEIGIRVHHNAIEVMDKQKTQKVYREYSKLYESKDKAIYKPTFIYNKEIKSEDREYFERLAVANGLTTKDIERYI